jgi:cytochrome c
MDILNKLVIPQSSQHIHILHYLLSLSLFLFVPFIGIILGGSTLAYIFKTAGQRNGNNFYVRLAKDIIDAVTVNKGVGIGLGLIPLVTIILILIQLLSTMPIDTVTYLTAAFVIILAALILLYTFRYTFAFADIYDSIKDIEPVTNTVHQEIEKFKKSNKNLSSQTAIPGLILIYLGIWVIVAALTLIVFQTDLEGKGIFSILFSWEVLSRYIYLIAASFMFTGATISFLFFFWDGGKKFDNDEYKNFVRKITIRVTLISGVVLPLFLFINLLGIPNNALSSIVFGFAFIALIFIFWAYHLLYYLIKNPYTKPAFNAVLFFVVLFSILSVLVKDQVTIANVTELQTEILNQKYNQYFANLEGAEQPVVVKRISGKEIYQNICSSCHAFDHKIVGPPYEQTLPSFEGKISDLVSFILSPTQKVPGYPPMPNPGLNPAQAKAIAKYEMIEYMKLKVAKLEKGPAMSGEEVYDKVCSSCHSYDHEEVGPAFDDALVKYSNKEDSLISFIANPTPQNPAVYPQMPKLGLRQSEIKAAADYVLNKLKTEGKNITASR